MPLWTDGIAVLPMYPNTYLRTYWQMQMRHEIFVAMSFDPRYTDRFNNIIKPAIRNVVIGGRALEPKRVDISKSGDSILTEIMDGVAHSQMVLVDVSTIGADKTTGNPYRNGNVMYELGLALACRQPPEVLLIRDDHDPILFDVTVIPHKTLDFTDPSKTVPQLTTLILDRLNERRIIEDTRIMITLAALGPEELEYLKAYYPRCGSGVVWQHKGTGNSGSLVAIPRLLDARVIQRVGTFDDGIAYTWTLLGYELARRAVEGGPNFQSVPTAIALPADCARAPLPPSNPST